MALKSYTMVSSTLSFTGTLAGQAARERFERVDILFAELPQNRFFGGKVLVQRPCGYVRFGRDVGQGCLLVSLLAEQVDGHIVEVLLGHLLVLLAARHDGSFPAGLPRAVRCGRVLLFYPPRAGLPNGRSAGRARWKGQRAPARGAARVPLCHRLPTEGAGAFEALHPGAALAASVAAVTGAHVHPFGGSLPKTMVPAQSFPAREGRGRGRDRGRPSFAAWRSPAKTPAGCASAVPLGRPARRFSAGTKVTLSARLAAVTGPLRGSSKGDRMPARLLKAAETSGFGAAVPFSWRFVELSFHNDNRLSWWLSPPFVSLELKQTRSRRRERKVAACTSLCLSSSPRTARSEPQGRSFPRRAAPPSRRAASDGGPAAE